MDLQKIKEQISAQYAQAGVKTYQVLDIRQVEPRSNEASGVEVQLGGWTDTPTEPSWHTITKQELRKIQRAMK